MSEPAVDVPGPTLSVYGGDCLTVLRTLPDASVHAVVTDPPYGLSQVDSEKLTTALTAWVNGDRERVPGGVGFMGKEWDAFVPPPAVWDECLRVLKPGGHMLVFAGSRTVDLMGLSIRLAGFEIRDTLQWLTAAGFPKSHDVSKALDKLAGAERGVVGTKLGQPGYHLNAYDAAGTAFDDGVNGRSYEQRLAASQITAPATDAAREWEGWGTALKPAAEPIILARKPLGERTVARNVLAHGVGGINIDGCRVESDGSHMVKGTVTKRTTVSGDDRTGKALGMYGAGSSFTPTNHEGGRFPANVILSHSETCDTETCEHGCAVAELDAQSGMTRSTGGASARSGKVGNGGTYGDYSGATVGRNAGGLGDTGGASRFFPTFKYQAKAPKSERPKVDGVAHPTVKPLALMRWLVRLVTPPGVQYQHCVDCGYDNDPMYGVQAAVRAKAEGTAGLLGQVSSTDRRPDTETSGDLVPDVRRAGGRGAEVLLDSVSGYGAENEQAGNVRGMRDSLSAETDEAADDVLGRVRSREGQGVGSDVRGVRDGVSPAVPDDALLSGMRIESKRATPSDGEADVDRPGIHHVVRTGASDGGQAGMRAGAPESDVGPSRPDIGSERGSASPQRGENGQPSGQPGGTGQGGTRQDSEAATEADSVSALLRVDQGLGPCPQCGGGLARVNRPGRILDPFTGTGTTLQAARDEGFCSIGIEAEPTYLPLIEQRIGRDGVSWQM